MSDRKNEALWIENRKRWQINVQRDGIRKTFVSGKSGRRGKAEAERKADAWIDSVATLDSARVQRRLDEYVEQLEKTASHAHYVQYEGIIRRYVSPEIGLKRMDKLTEGDLQDIIDRAYAERGLAHKTLEGVRACVLNWLKWSRKRGYTRLTPEELTIPRSASRPSKNVLEPESLTKLFQVSTTLYHRKRVEDWCIHAYRFAVLTGVRPGELRGLERGDVRGENVSIRRSLNRYGEETQGKNQNALRTFTMSPMAARVIAEQIEMLRAAAVVSPYLFPAEDGTALTEKQYYTAWSRYCESNRIPHISVYELRHTFVSVTKEMPEGLKKMVVGHSMDMDTEGVYGHEMSGDLKKAAGYVAAAFGEFLSN